MSRMYRLMSAWTRTWLRRAPLPLGAREFLHRTLRGWPHRYPRLSNAESGAVRPPHHACPAIGYRAGREHAPPTPRATLVAFYLPQFHPIPENDRWWGKGFTEWTNVSRAIPQFEGHHQPRLPGELGFYDLRLPEVMREQIDLARRYGIGAFCFYFYWFAGHRVLERPLQNYLSDPTLDFPFCLCWANEPWTRTWDGRAQDVLLPQTHNAEDDLAFIESVEPFLRDRRYLRVEGRPLLVLYRPELLPDPSATARRWRQHCFERGLGEIHLAYVESFERRDPADYGFDSAIEFPPNLTDATHAMATARAFDPAYRGEILDWRAMAAQFRKRRRPPYRLFRGVNPAWDNEARRPGAGRSYVHSAPRRYEDWLRATVDAAVPEAPAGQMPFVFINAWNEWAEGAHLEPDARLGHAWLEATRRAVMPESPAPARPCIVLHAHYPELLGELLDQIHASGLAHRLVITTSRERADAVTKVLAEHRASEADLRVYENRGRDLLPFLHVADSLIDGGERIILKLHTKRSPHLRDGATWRAQLLDALLAPERAHAAYDTLARDSRLGMIGPDGHLLDARRHEGANSARVSHLERFLGLEAAQGPKLFFAGNMFWVRLDALRPLLDAHLYPWQFEPEYGQQDGTLAHALERILPSVVRSAGYRVSTTAHPTVEARSAVPGNYRFVPDADDH